MSRIKGIALVNAVKALRLHRAAALKVLPPELHKYLTTRILVTKWFPGEDLIGLLRTLARIVPDPGYDVWEWFGRQGVKDDFETIYAALVKPGDPARTLELYPLTWSLYHDGGECHVTLEPGNRARIEIGDELTEFDEFCRLQTGHFTQLLLHAGAVEATVECLRVGDSRKPAQWQARWVI